MFLCVRENHLDPNSLKGGIQWRWTKCGFQLQNHLLKLPPCKTLDSIHALVSLCYTFFCFDNQICFYALFSQFIEAFLNCSKYLEGVFSSFHSLPSRKHDFIFQGSCNLWRKYLLIDTVQISLSSFYPTLSFKNRVLDPVHNFYSSHFRES